MPSIYIPAATYDFALLIYILLNRYPLPFTIIKEPPYKFPILPELDKLIILLLSLD